MSVEWALAASLLLLIGNGFFVASEFALVASKLHRLEHLASEGSRAAKAALAGSRELSVMLAGAQLGITLCSLGLGALAEPALVDAFEPLLRTVGAPEQIGHPIAFVVSLLIVVFAHMVIGEMAPKSWSIAHPERSALALALPFRAYTATVRHILLGLNGVSNFALRLVGVSPPDGTKQSQSPEELRLLLHQSREHGLLSSGQHRLLTRLLRVEQVRVSQLVRRRADIVTVSATADAARIEELTRASGRSRLAVTDASGTIVGMVHVREATIAIADAERGAGHRLPTAADLMTPPLVLSGTLSVEAAIRQMRASRTHIALVNDGDDQGLVSLEDLLETMLGAFYDETDPRASRRQ